MKVTYAKLRARADEWGIRVTETETAPVPGDLVSVTKKDSTTKNERVTEVVYAGQGYWLCAIKRGAKKDDTKTPAPASDLATSTVSNWAKSMAGYAGKICPQCQSEPLGANLSCCECGYKGDDAPAAHAVAPDTRRSSPTIAPTPTLPSAMTPRPDTPVLDAFFGARPDSGDEIDGYAPPMDFLQANCIAAEREYQERVAARLGLADVLNTANKRKGKKR